MERRRGVVREATPDSVGSFNREGALGWIGGGAHGAPNRSSCIWVLVSPSSALQFQN